MNAKRLLRPLEYVLIVATILECSSLYIEKYQNPFVTDMAVFFYGVIMILLAIDVVLHFIAFPVDKKEALRHLIPIAVIWGYSLVFFFVNVLKETDDWKKWDFLKNFMVVLPLFLIIMWFKQKIGKPYDLFFKYSNVVCVYSFFNLIVFLSGILNGASMPSDIVLSSSTSNPVLVNFYNLVMIHNGTAWQIADIPLLRNYGVFVEPLLHSIPLVVAIFTELFLRDEGDRLKYYKAVLLSLALLSCQSTMGLMVMVGAWGLKLIQLSIIKNKKFYILPAILFTIAAVAFLYYEKEMMRYDIEKAGSVYIHMEDVLIGFKAFLNKPVFGGGYQNTEYLNKFTESGGERTLTSSISIILAQGGIVLGGLCIAPFVILMLRLFKKGKRNLCLWAVGGLSVCVYTLIHYHVFLMMLMAFGYSQIGLFSVECKKDAEKSVVKEDVLTIKGHKMPLLVLVPLYLLLTAIMVRYGSPIWSGAYHFLRTHQWSLAQSPIKAFFFCCAVTINLVAISGAVRKKEEQINALSILLTDALYLLLYNYIYSVLDTYLSIKKCWNGVLEGVILFAVFLILYAVCHYTIVSVTKAKMASDYFLAAAPALLTALFLVVPGPVLEPYAYLADGYYSAVEPLLSIDAGELYAVDRPALFRFMSDRISYAGTRDGGFDSCKDTTVIFKKGSLYNFKEMFDGGFQVTELSEDLMAYSNDHKVIEELENLGYKWFRYYVYDQKVDLKRLADFNGLEANEDGEVLISGAEKSITKNSEFVLQKGKYTLSSFLHIDRKDYSGIADDTVIATIKVREKNYDSLLNARDIRLKDFDKDGNILVQLAFNIGGISRNYEYNILAREDYCLKALDITLCETPDYITVTKTDVYGNILREEYYHNDSTPYVMSSGYSAIERDYDLRGRNYGIRYFDGEGQRMTISSGYSGIRYSYNRKGSVIEEEYFDTEDKPQNLTSGYSKVKYEYDNKGNRIVTSYFDQKGKPILNRSGCAVIKRVFNEDNLAVREDYYDTKGEPICNSSGIAAIEREYEGKWVSLERYYGTEGEPSASLSGIFEIRYERDEKGRELLQTYYDENGEKMTCTGGYCGVRTIRNTVGSAIKTIYLDAEGEPVLNSSKIASIEREFNSDNNVIKECYYNAEGVIALNSSGIAGVLREYDKQKRNFKETYIDEEGKVKANTSGIASIVREYDCRNLNIREHYYDAEGNPVLNTGGVGQAFREYDEYNITTRYRYGDLEGNTVLNTSGIAEIAYVYDENWLTTEEHYFDTEGNPVLNTSQYAGIRREYTKRRWTHEEYLDTESNITTISNGSCGQDREYDKYGNLIKITYVDAEGNPILNTSGYSITIREFDKARNCIKENFYDTAGNPVNNTSGVYEIRRTYDRDRNATETIRLDVDGNQL